MESTMEELKAQICSRIGHIIGGTIDDLTDFWLEMYNPSQVRENLTKLVDHAQSFMDEISEETVNRKDGIEQQISELRDEQQHLQNLLQCPPLDTSQIATTPLFNYRVLLEQRIQCLRDQVNERHTQIEALRSRELALCTALADTSPIGLPLEPLPSANQIESFEWRLEELTAERDSRAQRMAELRASITAICAAIEMELPRDSRATLVCDPHAPLSAANCEKLAELERQLQHRQSALGKEVRTLQVQLQRLYARLEMSPRSRQLRLPDPLPGGVAVSGAADADDSVNCSRLPTDAEAAAQAACGLRYTKTSVDRLRAELERCERIKRANIQRFVEKVRREIERLWELCMRSDRERARFTHFTNDYYTEDLLQMHEMELADLERFYEDNAELFGRIEEHRTLWQRLLALEAKEKEPGRYKNRGGQLLQEEKERKVIAVKVPKILADIERLAGEYNAVNAKRPFTVWGRPVEEHIAELHEERKLGKEQQMSARKATPARPVGVSMLGAAAGGGAGGASSVQRSLMGVAGAGRTPMSVSRMNGGGGGGATLKRMASVTSINPVSSTKKLRIHTVPNSAATPTTATATTVTVKTAGATPAKPIKRNILSELAVSTTGATGAVGASTSSKKQQLLATSQLMRNAAAGSTLTPGAAGSVSKLTPHRFARPAPRSAVPVVGSLVVDNANRRRSRRRSVTKSASKRDRAPRVVVTDCASTADDSYELFEERVKTTSRSSVLPGTGPVAAAGAAAAIDDGVHRLGVTPTRPNKLGGNSSRSAAAGHTPAGLVAAGGGGAHKSGAGNRSATRRRSRGALAVAASSSRQRSPSPLAKLSTRLSSCEEEPFGADSHRD